MTDFSQPKIRFFTTERILGIVALVALLAVVVVLAVGWSNTSRSLAQAKHKISVVTDQRNQARDKASVCHDSSSALLDTATLLESAVNGIVDSLSTFDTDTATQAGNDYRDAEQNIQDHKQEIVSCLGNDGDAA